MTGTVVQGQAVVVDVRRMLESASAPAVVVAETAAAGVRQELRWVSAAAAAAGTAAMGVEVVAFAGMALKAVGAVGPSVMASSLCCYHCRRG